MGSRSAAPRIGDRNEHYEVPATEVTLTRGFWMGRCEVTQREWKEIMNRDLLEQARLARADPSTYLIAEKRRVRLATLMAGMKPGSENPEAPITWVSWTEATEFCRRLTAKGRAAGTIPAGFEYRLPTEAEWEYACRAGTSGDTYAGDLENPIPKRSAVLDPLAWYAGNAGPKPGARPVGTKRPNAWGLCDMLGNAAEWCLDWKGDYPGGSVTDWKGPASGDMHVKRGGGWNGGSGIVRAAYRDFHEAGFRWTNLGFRVVLGPKL